MADCFDLLWSEIHGKKKSDLYIPNPCQFENRNVGGLEKSGSGILLLQQNTGVTTNSATATNCVSFYDLRGIH